jgi:hypothetical protein
MEATPQIRQVVEDELLGIESTKLRDMDVVSMSRLYAEVIVLWFGGSSVQAAFVFFFLEKKI